MAATPTAGWIGKPIAATNSNILVNVPRVARKHATSQICSKFSAVQGYWQNTSFTALEADELQSCYLVRPSIGTLNHVLKSRIKWLHFVGDSNTRELFQRYNAYQLKIRGCYSHTFAEEKYPGRILCIKGGTILTYAWWYQEEARDSATNAAELQALSTISLRDT